MMMMRVNCSYDHDVCVALNGVKLSCCGGGDCRSWKC
jgi:hypothetical protein